MHTLVDLRNAFTHNMMFSFSSVHPLGLTRGAHVELPVRCSGFEVWGSEIWFLCNMPRDGNGEAARELFVTKAEYAIICLVGLAVAHKRSRT